VIFSGIRVAVSKCKPHSSGAESDGLMAAEVLVGGGAERVRRLRRHAIGGAQFYLGGRGGFNLKHSERCRSSSALSRGRGQLVAAIEAFPRTPTRMERGRWGKDLVGLQREGVSQKPARPRPLARCLATRLDAAGVQLPFVTAGAAGMSAAVCCFKPRMGPRGGRGRRKTGSR